MAVSDTKRTSISVVKLEKVTLLVQFVGVIVEECKNALELGQRILANFHDWWLVCLYHRHRA